MKEKKRLSFSISERRKKKGTKESWLVIVYFVTLLFGQVDRGFVDASLIGRAMGMSFCHRLGIGKGREVKAEMEKVL